MKIAKTFSIDSELLKKIESISIENKIPLSDIVTRLIETGFKVGETINVKCPMCSTTYSNKEGFCPKCKIELDNREKELILEKDLSILKQRLEKLIEWKAKGFFVADNEINHIKEKIEELERGL